MYEFLRIRTFEERYNSKYIVSIISIHKDLVFFAMTISLIYGNQKGYRTGTQMLRIAII